MSEKQNITKKRLFFKKKNLSLYEEEQVQSPLRTMIKSFFTRKLTIFGLSVFGFILGSCLILPFFMPNDKLFTDSTQNNLAPGFHYMKVPSAISKNARIISAGNNYAAGVDRDGKVHVWGNTSGVNMDRLTDVPENMGNIVQISAGLNHILAVNDNNEIFTWGATNRFNLDKIPSIPQGANIVQIIAGHQMSVVLDDTGKLHVWGNDNIISLSTRNVQGKIIEVEVNNHMGIVLTEDKRVFALTTRDYPITRVPESIQERTVGIAVTDKSAAALLDDGTVVVWGLEDYDVYDIPDKIQGHVSELHAGRGHFTVLLDDGDVVSWGWDYFGQASVPFGTHDIVSVGSGFFQNYAVDQDGKVTGWGLKGYIMGTDQLGRDVFRRLLTAGRTSMTIGAVAVIIASFIGIILGAISGYFGKTVDLLMMRLAEVWGAIPFLPIAIILSVVMSNKVSESGRVLVIMVIQGILNWPSMARLVRSQMLAAKNNDFVLAAQSVGIKTSRVIFRHIFPNIIAIVSVRLAASLAGSMLSESSLSFLGLGIVEPTPTWGNMLNSCVDSYIIKNFWWRWVFPSIALGMSVLSLYIVGDGMREAIDPKSAGR